jgi:lipopolysaccharide biosynthesis glycosyltransferase
MAKNLVYMVAVDHPTSKLAVSDYAQYSIPTWKHWCRRHKVDFHVVREHDPRLGRPIWNKEKVHAVTGYEKIAVVDSDTMVRWDAPNLFDGIRDGVAGVVDTADLGWVFSSVDAYQHLFPGQVMDYTRYLNAGVLFFTDTFRGVFKDVLDFYFAHQAELDAWDKGGGREQTILNFHLQQREVPLQFLTPEWNLFSMHRKNMFGYNWQLQRQEPVERYFTRYAYVWHFTGFELEQRTNLMRMVWEGHRERYT